MKKFAIVTFCLLLLTGLAYNSYAKIGVGVGIGKIQVDEKLKPGIIYQLPSLSVLNTGDEPSEYEVSIEYHETQTQLRPQKTWFIFSPQKFHLEPGGIQQVDVKLNLPLKMEPGDYFAYLEAHPLKKAEQGQTSVGIAAAAKLYFTVVPTNFFYGIYYKIISLWKVYSPIPQYVIGTTFALAAIFLFKKYFNIQINVKKPVNNTPEETKKDE